MVHSYEMNTFLMSIFKNKSVLYVYAVLVLSLLKKS